MIEAIDQEESGEIVVLDSITKLSHEHRGAVVVAASHAGKYSAAIAVRGLVRGAILNDASVGLDRAGIAGLDLLSEFRIPGAACDYRSARIGDAEDQIANGIISFANSHAEAFGCQAGMPASACARAMKAAAGTRQRIAVPSEREGRWLIREGRVRIWALDSASLTEDDRDDGQILVTGSHGALLGHDPRVCHQDIAKSCRLQRRREWNPGTRNEPSPGP